MRDGLDILVVKALHQWESVLTKHDFTRTSIAPRQGLHDHGKILFTKGIEAIVVQPFHWYGAVKESRTTIVYATPEIVRQLREQGYTNGVGEIEQVAVNALRFGMQKIDSSKAYAVLNNNSH